MTDCTSEEAEPRPLYIEVDGIDSRYFRQAPRALFTIIPDVEEKKGTRMQCSIDVCEHCWLAHGNIMSVTRCLCFREYTLLGKEVR